VAYKSERGELLKASEDEAKQIDQTSSIGLLLREDGTVIDVVPGLAADKAGIGPHMKVLAVNGRRLSAERLRAAVASTASGHAKANDDDCLGELRCSPARDGLHVGVADCGFGKPGRRQEGNQAQGADRRAEEDRQSHRRRARL